MSSQIERAFDILRQGGSVYMHKNDAQGIRDKVALGNYVGWLQASYAAHNKNSNHW